MNTRLTVGSAVATIAASIALHPLIDSSTWFWEGVGAVLVVAGVASLTRLRQLSVLICLPVTAFGLLLYVNLVFSWQQSFGGVLPTLASLAGLLRLNSAGWAEAARYAPPVPGFRAVSFLAVCGIGIAALFTDLLAVRLRKAAAAGIPLLALFSATVASKASAPTIEEAAIFSAGVAGYLALLVADSRERIQVWGRLVSARVGRFRVVSVPQHTQLQTTGQFAAADTRTLAAVGRRVGTAAVAAALLVPLLVPGLKARDLFGSSGGSGHGPGALATLPDPLVQMNQQLHLPRARTILTYRTDNPDPPYLRVYSLDLTPTGGSWTLYVQQAAVMLHNDKLPAAPGLQGAPYRLTHTIVTMAHGVTGSVAEGSHIQNFLPLPYPPVKVKVDGDWAVDPGTLMMWSGTSISGMKYEITSKDVEPSSQQLRQAPPPASAAAAQEVNFPPVYNSLLRLARQITAKALTPYDKAVKLQQWFTAPGNFTYNLNASDADSPAGLKHFLLESKRGFCQQFAFAFALLARLLGIPARVAVGYTAGAARGDGIWRVTTTDAHAWPELYFQGAGWLPWEPTPAGLSTGQATAKTPAYTLASGRGSNSGNASGAASVPSSGSQPGSQAGSGISQHQRFAADENGKATAARKHDRRPWGWWLLGLAALALAVMLTPMVTRQVSRRRRLMIIDRPASTAAADGTSAVDGARARAGVRAAWLEVRDDLADFGIGCSATESPRAVVNRVCAQLELSAAPQEALRRIALAEERAQYASRLDAPRIRRADLTVVHRTIAASADPRARWRARLWPASKLSALRQGARHALDVFGWIEVATSWVMARLRSGRHEPGGAAAS